MKKGFTVLELVLVLFLLLLLLWVSIPQILNFKEETRLKNLRKSLDLLRSSITSSVKYAQENCSSSVKAPPLDALVANDMSFWKECSDQSFEEEDKKIIKSGLLPENPFRKNSDIIRGDSRDNPCFQVSGEFAWRYDPNTGHIWANSSDSYLEECSL